MKNTPIVLTAFTVLVLWQSNLAQPPQDDQPPPPPAPKATPLARKSNSAVADLIAKNLPQIASKTPVSRTRREQAYAKMLEGQRAIWNLRNQRTPAAQASVVQAAKKSFQEAVELDPLLAEGYTALAEWSELEDGIALANVAVRIEPESFGAHRILARLYTFRSRLNKGVLDQQFADKAIAEWREVGRLDPRNAEAFAFLSEFYARAKKPTEQIDALRRWQSAAAPLDSYFYRRVMGDQSSLAPDAATTKYGQALLAAGENRQAIEVLSRHVADNPEADEAVELLRQAIESADAPTAATAVNSLQQAIFANPENATLVDVLAQIQVRGGRIDDAAKTLRDASLRLADKNKNAAAALQISLGEIYADANRFDEAVAAYQTALNVRGVTDAVTDADRDFAIRVFDRMIEIYKTANRPNDGKAVIERARLVLGKNDLFADKRLISFYVETGKRAEALQAVRALRAKQLEDYSLLRLEAEILTGSGKVDEAVALVKTLIGKKMPTAILSGDDENGGGDDGGNLIMSPQYDDFSNQLFIANLYSQAKRGKEAVEAVNQAVALARTADRREIARLTLASIQHTAGDFRGAEETLRDILKQSPRNPIALNNLGYFLTERDEKFDEALKLIEQAIEIDPLNSSYLDSLGWVYFKLGKLPEAEKYLKDALRVDDTSSTIHEHLGDVYQKQGKPDLARASWQKALGLTTDEDEIKRLKAKINLKK